MKVKELLETPYLNDEELGYEVLANISNEALARSYSLLSKVKGLEIYQKNTTGFIAGKRKKSELSTVVIVNCRKEAYPCVPTQLGSDYQQVSFVRVSKGYESEGNPKLVYNEIAKHIDLVSDHEQYLGGQGLWKSLARESDVNVYVFDGRIKDYIRDETGKPKKYNSSNISAKKIWASKETYRLILLVATDKELT